MIDIRYETIYGSLFALGGVMLAAWGLLGGRPPALRYVGNGLVALAILSWALAALQTWLVLRAARGR